MLVAGVEKFWNLKHTQHTHLSVHSDRVAALRAVVVALGTARKGWTGPEDADLAAAQTQPKRALRKLVAVFGAAWRNSSRTSARHLWTAALGLPGDGSLYDEKSISKDASVEALLALCDSPQFSAMVDFPTF